MWDGRELRRALSGGRELGKASLEDYAYVAYGMAAYADLSGESVDRAFLTTLLDSAWQRSYGPGGWRMDDHPLIPGMGERAALLEGALPAPSALLVRIAIRSDDSNLVAKALAAAELGRRATQQQPFWYAGHHAALLEAATRMQQ